MFWGSGSVQRRNKEFGFQSSVKEDSVSFSQILFLTVSVWVASCTGFLENRMRGKVTNFDVTLASVKQKPFRTVGKISTNECFRYKR